MVQRNAPDLSIARDVLAPVLGQLRAELGVPTDFPPEVHEQVAAIVADWQAFLAAVQLPEPSQDLETLPDLAAVPDPGARLSPAAIPRLDGTHIPLVTIDPEGSRDLDQAVHLTRLTDGQQDGARYLVSYAIASLATFVQPGSPLDLEVRSRGLTLYFPDESTPLHPVELSHGAASLLPGQLTPACLWQIRVGGDGKRLSATVRRALVRSRAQLTYTAVQDALDNGTALDAAVPADLPALLKEIGLLRVQREAARGGVSLTVPEQEVVSSSSMDEGAATALGASESSVADYRGANAADEGAAAAVQGEGAFALAYRTPLLVEDWNAEISLMTGMSAAAKMRGMGVGVLRTVPPASDQALKKLRRVAKALKVEWPKEMGYPELIRSLDPASPTHAAFMLECTSLFRGSGYTVFGVEGEPPFPPEGSPETLHGAIAAEYAHATAPLRRLVDRWSSELCIAADEGRAPEQWVLDTLKEIPSDMGRAGQLSSKADRGSTEAIEALILQGHEGDVMTGAIVDIAEGKPYGTVMISRPAVMGSVTNRNRGEQLPLGTVTDVRLSRADVATRKVEFAWPADDTGEVPSADGHSTS